MPIILTIITKNADTKIDTVFFCEILLKMEVITDFFSNEKIEIQEEKKSKITLFLGNI